MNNKRNYNEELEALSDQFKNYYSVILSNSQYILDNIIRVYSSRIGSSLCDEAKIESFFFQDVDNFSRFDKMTISFLHDVTDFNSYVEKELVKGKSNKDAIVQSFIECGLNSNKGTERSRFFFAIKDYVRFIMRGNRLYSSIEDLEEKHYQFSVEHNFDEGENKLNKHVMIFSEIYCSDDIEKKIFYATQQGWTTYTDIVKAIGETKYSEYQIIEITKYIIRKFACYLTVYENSIFDSVTLGYDDKGILSRKDLVMKNAKVSSIDEAKKVLETPRLKKEYVQFNSVEEDLDELRSFCNCRGIKYVEGNFSCNVIMKLYYSVGERESKKTPKTCIYKNGSYLDFVTKQKGFIKDIK